MKAFATARPHLAELKEYTVVMRNKNILINELVNWAAESISKDNPRFFKK